jgi:hypothetical protein
VAEDEECFEILYSAEVPGISTRSFEEFSSSSYDPDWIDYTSKDGFLGDFGFFDTKLDEINMNNDSRGEHVELKELKRNSKKTRKSLKEEKEMASRGKMNKSLQKSMQDGGATSVPSSPIAKPKNGEPRRRRRQNMIYNDNSLSSPRRDVHACHGEDDSRPPRPEQNDIKNKTRRDISPILDRSASNRSEMSQLIKKLRKDRERAERDREIALRLKQEMQTYDVNLLEAKQMIAPATDTISEVQYRLSKLEAARLRHFALMKPKVSITA